MRSRPCPPCRATSAASAAAATAARTTGARNRPRNVGGASPDRFGGPEVEAIEQESGQRFAVGGSAHGRVDGGGHHRHRFPRLRLHPVGQGRRIGAGRTGGAAGRPGGDDQPRDPSRPPRPTREHPHPVKQGRQRHDQGESCRKTPARPASGGSRGIVPALLE